MGRPIVAIVGRPNVGKSTLFNRLIGRRQAIVDSTAGLTRDRLYGVAEWAGREFTVVDTAGLELQADGGRDAVEAQTRVAIAEAEAIILLLDVRQGLLPIDRDIAQLLRRVRAKVVVAANKADTPGEQYFLHELLELGFRDPVLISAQHGIGVDDLLDRVLEVLPADDAESPPYPPHKWGGRAAGQVPTLPSPQVGRTPPPPSPDAAEVARLAIMGRPNVGKSSVLNALLGDERALVSETPGTTRDPVDTVLTFDGLPVVLVDTAGIRRRSGARDRLERFGLLRGIRAMERSDAVLLIMDASEGVLVQDQHVAGYALEAGKGLVFVLNKIDLVEREFRSTATWRRQIQAAFRFVPHVPLVTVSALTGASVQTILPAALEVVGQRRIRVPTNQLNRILREAFANRPPPSYKGRRLQLNFATQAAAETPTIVLFVNDTGLLHFSYRRYLENRLREHFGFAGNPIRLVLRKEKEKAKRR